MNENIQAKLAIEIASKTLTIAKLEAQNEELQAQLQQVLEHNTELKESSRHMNHAQKKHQKVR